MNSPRLYSEFASWWHVMSAPEDYAEEARIFHAALSTAVDGPLESLLEFGSGGGNTASHLKNHASLTLVEPAEGMRALSERINPQCEHLAGDMRTARLGQTFDAAFIHDAIAYMTNVEDLRAAIETAFVHCRPGGAALFVPDHTRETWKPETSSGGHDDRERSMRYLSWTYDPDPSDTHFITAYAFLMREGNDDVRCEKDIHVEGLFSRATWVELIESAGFTARTLPFDHSSFEKDHGHELFLGYRPTGASIPHID